MSTADKVCRLCMGRSNLNHTVLEEQFLQKIAICVSLLINPEDKSLPLELCVLCALKVKDFYEFRQNCLEVQRLLEQDRPTVGEPPCKVPKVVQKQEPLANPEIVQKQEPLANSEIVQKQEPLAEPEVLEAADECETVAATEEFDEVEEHFDDQVAITLIETDELSEDQVVEDSLEVPEEEDPESDSKYELLVESDYEIIADDQLESFQSESCEEAVIEYLSYDESTQDQSEPGDSSIDVKSVLTPEERSKAVARRQKSGLSRKNRDEKEIYRSLLLECETCGKSVERNRMEGHRNRHEGIRPYKCPAQDCDTEFHCKISLRLHFNNRHSTAEFKCELCNKVYNSRKTLYHHKRETHAEKQFQCDQCDQKFVSNARLNRHKVTHTDLREHKCPHCLKEFHRSNNLKVHLRSHTKEKPFECPLCDKAFGYQRLLRSHLERKHADA